MEYNKLSTFSGMAEKQASFVKEFILCLTLTPAILRTETLSNTLGLNVGLAFNTNAKACWSA